MYTKRGMCWLLAVLLTFCLILPVQAESSEAVGDVSGDERIDSTDARLVLQAAVNKIGLSNSQKGAADVDSSGGIDSSDARFILQYSVGKIQEFPAAPLSHTVWVTIPEGYSIPRIAALLEKKGVCSAEAFYRAVQTADISDYAFASALPDWEEQHSAGRAFRLEGYLFPDTYEFYRNCSGEAALRRFLENFDRRTEALREQLGERSLDDVVTLASIVQGEVGYAQDMRRVARVLQNRLNDPAAYPRLQCDATGVYIDELTAVPAEILGDIDIYSAYDTYHRTGLTAGAINNPGMEALMAVLQPSDEEEIVNCYYFASDFKTGITYYSKTYEEHVAVCEQYGIGIYA